jgi:hypothetical protein
MEEPNFQEMWQIEVGGQIYEANLLEMADWIAGGSLQPWDKVRKGNLRWIEARRVPTLIRFFNAKASGQPVKVLVNSTEAPDATVSSPDAQTRPATFTNQTFEPAVSARHISADRDICASHPGVPSFYVCSDCGAGFCKACPKAFGGAVRICPACGGLCKTIADAQRAERSTAHFGNASTAGFGFADFTEAIAYPWKFKPSLVLGGAMFAFFNVGQSAAGWGGIHMIVAAAFCFMLANMLTFGVLANVTENFAQGRIGTNFMHSFEDFSIWDDVLHPLFLSIATYISAFGPFLLVMSVGLYLVLSALSAEAAAEQQELQRLPGTPYYDTARTIQQSDKVKDLLNESVAENQRKLAIQSDPASAGQLEGPQDTEATVMQADQLIRQTRQQQLESTFGKSPETKEKEFQAIVTRLLTLAAPLVIFGTITLLWGLFYFPAACIVAGYTRTFSAAINPVVGLDTIKRLGADYFKILIMGLALLIAMTMVAAVLSVVLSPFDMPTFGNVPANALYSLFAFYSWVVFCCVLGFAMFKSAGRLKLLR